MEGAGQSKITKIKDSGKGEVRTHFQQFLLSKGLNFNINEMERLIHVFGRKSGIRKNANLS